MITIFPIDIGGTHLKALLSREQTSRKFDSGPALTPEQIFAGLRRLPHNLGKAWVGFNYESFDCRAKMINDAAMQALGS